MASQCDGNWTRIGDNALGFGVQRFQDGNKNSLWRLRITKHANQNVIDMDASIGDLREIKRWCDNAIKILETDGGRNATVEEDAGPVAARAAM